jgi:hypothetical protein
MGLAAFTPGHHPSRAEVERVYDSLWPDGTDPFRPSEAVDELTIEEPASVAEKLHHVEIRQGRYGPDLLIDGRAQMWLKSAPPEITLGEVPTVRLMVPVLTEMLAAFNARVVSVTTVRPVMPSEEDSFPLVTAEAPTLAGALRALADEVENATP